MSEAEKREARHLVLRIANLRRLLSERDEEWEREAYPKEKFLIDLIIEQKKNKLKKVQ